MRSDLRPAVVTSTAYLSGGSKKAACPISLVVSSVMGASFCNFLSHESTATEALGTMAPVGSVTITWHLTRSEHKPEVAIAKTTRASVMKYLRFIGKQIRTARTAST